LKVFPAARIGILGVAYKVDTSSTKNSIAIDIMERFSDKISGYYDPCATITEFGTLVKEYKSAELCVGDSDVVLILTPWPEFKTLDFNFIFREDCPKNIVIDPFNILNDIRIPREIELITLVAK
jgi:UDPglucose 6-dehydrogenase